MVGTNIRTLDSKAVRNELVVDTESGDKKNCVQRVKCDLDGVDGSSHESGVLLCYVVLGWGNRRGKCILQSPR